MGSLQLFDTHCHIQESGFDATAVLLGAAEAGVTRLMCVGTDLDSSKAAVALANIHKGIWASIGLHPHESSKYTGKTDLLAEFSSLAKLSKVKAIGECGLDYYYDHSPEKDQMELLHFQLDLAAKSGLPVIFHVRDAFEAFWQVYDQYKGLNGVIHSFTATQDVLDQALSRGLYIGLNGIITFTKDPDQLEMAKAVPQGRILLETDAPYLTPIPKRGTMNEPKFLLLTAEFLSRLRDEPLDEIARASTENARELFKIPESL